MVGRVFRILGKPFWISTAALFTIGAFGSELTKKKNEMVRELRDEEEPEKKAICVLRGDGNITGIVKFTQLEGKVVIEGEITSLKKGKHGFHVHEKGDLSQGCATAGPHYNPFNKKHGGPGEKERHVGDLGNIDVKIDNTITKFKIEDPVISLTGRHSIIGRSVVVHADEDDLGKGGFPDSSTTGHSGGRVACGVIGRA